MESLLALGDEFPVCELDTAAGKGSVGAMICYDLAKDGPSASGREGGAAVFAQGWSALSRDCSSCIERVRFLSESPTTHVGG